MTKTDATFLAFSLRIVDFEVQFFLRCKFSSTLESSLTVAWFAQTNQNSLPTHSNQWDCFILYRSLMASNGFFRICQNGEGPTFARPTCTKAAFMRTNFISLLYKTNRFHVAVHLSSNRSQRTSKCGTNISDTLGYRLVPLFCSYHILTSSMIFYWTDAQQHGIYLLNRSKRGEYG